MLSNLMIDMLSKQTETGKVPKHVSMGGFEKPDEELVLKVASIEEVLEYASSHRQGKVG